MERLKKTWRKLQVNWYLWRASVYFRRAQTAMYKAQDYGAYISNETHNGFLAVAQDLLRN